MSMPPAGPPVPPNPAETPHPRMQTPASAQEPASQQFAPSAPQQPGAPQFPQTPQPPMPQAPPSDSEPPGKNRRLLWIVAAIVVVVLAGGGIGGFWLIRSNQDRAALDEARGSYQTELETVQEQFAQLELAIQPVAARLAESRTIAGAVAADRIGDAALLTQLADAEAALETALQQEASVPDALAEESKTEDYEVAVDELSGVAGAIDEKRTAVEAAQAALTDVQETVAESVAGAADAALRSIRSSTEDVDLLESDQFAWFRQTIDEVHTVTDEPGDGYPARIGELIEAWGDAEEAASEAEAKAAAEAKEQQEAEAKAREEALDGAPAAWANIEGTWCGIGYDGSEVCSTLALDDPEIDNVYSEMVGECLMGVSSSAIGGGMSLLYCPAGVATPEDFTAGGMMATVGDDPTRDRVLGYQGAGAFWQFRSE